MSKKSALQVTDLFALSDILQMELTLRRDGAIRGELSRSVEVPDVGLKMNMKVKVGDSKIGWRTEKGKVYPVIALMAHVQGDLYLLVVDDKKDEEIRVLVLDKAREKVPGDVRWAFRENESKSVSGVVTWLHDKGMVVAEYVREEYGTEWKAAA